MFVRLLSNYRRAGIISQQPLEYEAGQIYEIEDDIGEALVKRGVAEEIVIDVSETIRVIHRSTGAEISRHVSEPAPVVTAPQATVSSEPVMPAPAAAPAVPPPAPVEDPNPEPADTTAAEGGGRRRKQKAPRRFAATKEGAVKAP